MCKTWDYSDENMYYLKRQYQNIYNGGVPDYIEKFLDNYIAFQSRLHCFIV